MHSASSIDNSASTAYTPGSFSRLHYWIFTPVQTKLDRRIFFWVSLSLAMSFLMGYGPLRQAFSGGYVLQDDSRQHIFWMQRFVDPNLFPHVRIVDYFQSVAPEGYQKFYANFAMIGVDPLTLSKLLPMALGLLTTLICFVVSMQLLPVPSSAFFSATLLSEAVWASDSVISSTPRAFLYPLLLLFLSTLLARSIIPCLISIALLCLFYAPLAPVPLVVICLRLIRLDSHRLRISRERRDYVLCVLSALVAALILLPYLQNIAPFGPVVSAAEAKSMPEFLPGGRMVVFREGVVSYWLKGRHTGLFASLPVNPVCYPFALLLPFLWITRYRFQLAMMIRPGIEILPRLIIASLVMFFTAHALLFTLYLPSRFTSHTFRIVLSLSAGISAVILLEAVLNLAAQTKRQTVMKFVVCVTGIVFVGLLLYPLLSGSLSRPRYKTGKYARLYEFLLQQPSTTMIASLSREVDDLPVFAKKSILFGRETALPFHKSYYDEIRRRALELIDAEYSSDIQTLQKILRAHNINFILLDKLTFSPGYLAGDKWLMQFQPAANEAIDIIRRGEQPALARLLDQFTVLEVDDLVLLDAKKVLDFRTYPE
jgi:hypothetical protein